MPTSGRWTQGVALLPSSSIVHGLGTWCHAVAQEGATGAGQGAYTAVSHTDHGQQRFHGIEMRCFRAFLLVGRTEGPWVGCSGWPHSGPRPAHRLATVRPHRAAPSVLTDPNHERA